MFEMICKVAILVAWTSLIGIMGMSVFYMYIILKSTVNKL